MQDEKKSNRKFWALLIIVGVLVAVGVADFNMKSAVRLNRGCPGRMPHFGLQENAEGGILTANDKGEITSQLPNPKTSE